MALPSLTHSVDKEFGFGIVGVDIDRRDFPFAPRPRPVGQHVQGGGRLVPNGAVEIVAVLGQGGEVDNAEEGGVRRPGIGVVGRRFTEVVEACPDKLPHRPGIVFGEGEIDIGGVRPRTILCVVARRLMVGIDGIGLQHNRKLVDTTAAHRRGRFRTEHHILRQTAIGFGVAVGTVVEARHVHDGGEPIVEHTTHLVHTAGDGTRGVFAMADVAKHRGHLVAFGRTLRGHFVADAPHHHGGRVAILPQEVDHVAFRPFVEVAVIAVLALGDVPLVEGFEHHHEAHLLTELHEFGGGHVVGGADGVAAHVLEDGELVAEGTHIDRRPERAKVVVVADAAKLAQPTVEEKSLVGHHLDAAHTEARFVSVAEHAFGVDFCHGAVEMRRFGRPKVGALNDEVLRDGQPMRHISLVGLGRHHVPLFVAQGGFEGEPGSVGPFHVGLQADGGIVFCHVGRGELCAPDGHVDAVGFDQAHVAVKSRPGIPAA